MSIHFIHRYKYSHDARRKQVTEMVSKGLAVKIKDTKQGFLVDTGNVDYRVSRKGRLIKTSVEER